MATVERNPNATAIETDTQFGRSFHDQVGFAVSFLSSTCGPSRPQAIGSNGVRASPRLTRDSSAMPGSSGAHRHRLGAESHISFSLISRRAYVTSSGAIFPFAL